MSESSAADLLLSALSDAGWAPIHAMARLLGDYLGTSPEVLDPRDSLGRAHALRSALPRRRGERTGIVIASDPVQLNAVFHPGVRRRRYRRLVGWVLDSFWTERIPRAARSGDLRRDLRDGSAGRPGLGRRRSAPCGGAALGRGCPRHQGCGR